MRRSSSSSDGSPHTRLPSGSTNPTWNSMPTSFGSHSRSAASEVSSRKQRARQLAGVGDQLVVGLDLVRDLLVAQHPLGARHLLHLPAHRVGVLEQDREDRSERDAARALHLDDARAEARRARVRRRAGRRCRRRSACARHSSSIPYARASTCSGWTGRLLRALVDRDVGELAVAHDQLLFGLAHAFHQRPGNAPRELDVLGPQSPRAVDRRAPLDRRHLRRR